MTLKRISGAVAPALLAALAAAGSGVPAAQAEAVKLKAASFLPQRVIVAKHFYEWAEKVNEECAGEVEISVVGPASSRTRPQIESSRLRGRDGSSGDGNTKGLSVRSCLSRMARAWTLNGTCRGPVLESLSANPSD